MKRLAFAIALAIGGFGSPGSAVAVDPRYPDWPCVQAKVPEISVAAVWAGPPIDDVGNAWQEDERTATLIERLAARRTPIEEAEDAITDYMTSNGAAKEEKAKLLFAGLLTTLNRERSEVMAGLERLTRRQRTFGEKIQADAARLREMQSAADRDEAAIAELTKQIEWETRIFEERRKSIQYACEVPVAIDQRLFALGRLIQQDLD